MTFLHQLFELRKCGPERGGTAPYNVIFRLPNRHPTVNQFLSSIISHKEDWGKIKIAPDQSYKTIWKLILYPGEVDTLHYRWGEWGKNYDIFVEKYGDRKIELATADGGWSFMDYVLLLEDDNMKYKAFDNIDIPTDFEVQFKTIRSNVQNLRSDDILLEEEFDIIMSILDGSEARALSRVRKLTNGDTY